MPRLVNFMQHSQAASWLVCIALLLVLFTDSLTQLGFAHGILYTPVIALAGLSTNRLLLHGSALFALCGIWLGFFIAPTAPAEFSAFYVIANRSISCLAILLLWWFGIQGIQFRRAQQQQQQHESQMRLDLALVNKVAGLSHWWLDCHQKKVKLDTISQHLLGVTRSELTLEQFVCCFEWHEQEDLKQQLEQVLTRAEPLSLELKLHNEHHSAIWVRLIAYADPAEPELIRGLLQNIQQHYDEAQRANSLQLRFKQLADSMPVKVWTATADGMIDFVSDTFAQFSGKTTSQIVSDWLALLHPDDRERTAAYWLKCVSSKSHYQIEFRICRQDGSYIWHLTSARPIYDDRGQLLYWFGSAMDISEQKRLWQQTDQLRQALYQTLNDVSDPFFTLDQHLNFTFMNQSALELFADPKIPVMGKALTEVFYRPGQDFSGLTSAIQRSFMRSKPEQLRLRVPNISTEVTLLLYPSDSGIHVLLQPAPATTT